MTTYVISNASGTVERITTSEAELQQLRPGETVTNQPGPVNIPPRPGAAAVLRETAGTLRWDDTRSLDECKADKWADVKAERSRLEASTFECAGLTFDCNGPAIAGATLAAVIAKMAGTPWSQPWVLADNSVTELDVDQMIAAGQAGKAYISGLWTISQALRQQIDAAQTAEAVAAVAWP